MSARLGFGQRLKAREQVLRDVRREAFNERIEAPGFISPADTYAGDAFDLHVHFLVGGNYYCAVLECGDGVGGLAVDLHFDFREADDDRDEFSVLVGILEATEQRERMTCGFLAVSALA